MKQIKKYLKKIVFWELKPLLVLSVLVSVILFIVFFFHWTETILAYITYFFSAYTLSVCLIRMFYKIREYQKVFLKFSIFRRYKTDLIFKAEISLYISLGINLVYSFYKAFAGIYYHSIWFGTVACYYIILSIERFFLLHHIRKKQKDYMAEMKKCYWCGCLLLALTIVIIGMSIYMIHKGQVTIYPEHIIYAAAGYTFYNFISAVINTVKYRKASSPIYHTSKLITLATALVSVFSLQTSMLTEFGNDYHKQKIMNVLTGFVVFMGTIGIALYMIIRSKILIHRGNRYDET